MKILKVFGIVVGIHVFALILIFANPGCSSTTKPPPAPAETVTQEAPPVITLPVNNSVPSSTGPTITFNPDAPATYAPAQENSGTSRYVPTRPNTPAASAVTAQPVENITPATTHVVKSGDSLWTLGKRYHIDYREIAAANNLKTSAVLREGQRLIIPSRTTAQTSSTRAPAATEVAAAPAQAPKSSGKELRHTVMPGETLGGIAKKYDVRPRDLYNRNNISDPQKVRAGTELIIPGWSGTAKASSEGVQSAPVQPAPVSQPSTTFTQPATLSQQPAAPVAQPPAPAPQPVPSIQLEPEVPAQAPASNVPVIRIDDNPLTPAPAPKS